MRKTISVFALGILLIQSGPVPGAELAGVTMPDTAAVSGKRLELNGLGLRTKLFFKIYVAGLYLETPTRDAAAAAGTDQTKRVVMHFLYKKVTSKQLVDTWQEGFRENSPAAAGKLKEEISRFCSWMGDVAAGQEIVLTYEPGAGTSVEMAGQKKGTIPGTEFMRALFLVWLGDHPPTRELKEGMLGVKS
jgi:hypothetical protein